MNRKQLVEHIRNKQSCLCVGLDPDLSRIPPFLLSDSDPLLEFNKRIIHSTLDHCVAYKINTAFYEVHGARGWETLAKTINFIPRSHFIIADAKRGDIGNTSAKYAQAFFETLNVDALTVAPYMGEDSVKPFLDYTDKWTILLGLTSNSGAADFELQRSGQEYWFETVMRTASKWGSPDNLMFVIGATQAARMERIRQLTPDHFYLVPGVGTQGGDLSETMKNGMNREVGLLINVSRGILYASAEDGFDKAAARAAANFHSQMKAFL
jgi:orotidine-5'-phosphate decarboxylase